MKRILTDRRVLASAAAVALLLSVALWPTTIPVDAATISRHALVVTVNEEGRTRVRDRFVVSAPAGGRVLRVELEPGDRVKRGDVVARIQPGMSPLIDTRARSESEAALRSARAVLGRAQAEQRRADTALAHAERELDRTRRLASEGVISTQELDAREAEARAARDAASAAAFAVQAAAADVDQLIAHLRGPSSAPEAEVVAVFSPADGVILRRLRESEAVVPAGEPLVEIGDANDIEVVVDLLSTDAARVRPGSRATFTAAHDHPPLAGRVRRIEPSGFTKISALGVEEQRVNVILDMEQAGSEDPLMIGDGYRVDVAIVINEIARALIVPTSALFRDGDRWAAYELRDGRARLVLLEIGAQTPREAEVRTGIAEGARVIAHPGERISDGVRVEAREQP